MRQGTSDGELRTAIRTLSLGTEAEAERATAEVALLHGLEDLDDLRRLVRNRLRRWQRGQLVGWMYDEEVRKILEEVEPIANWANETAPKGPVKDQAQRAQKTIRDTLDAIRKRTGGIPSWGNFECP